MFVRAALVSTHEGVLSLLWLQFSCDFHSLSKPVYCPPLNSGDGEASHQIETCALSLVSHVHVIALLITHNCIRYIYVVWFYCTRQFLVYMFSLFVS